MSGKKDRLIKGILEIVDKARVANKQETLVEQELDVFLTSFLEKAMPKLYNMEVSYKNNYELVYKFLTLYSVASNLHKGKNYLRPRLAEVLVFYVLKGYSAETKKIILDSIPKMNTENLNQINAELQKKGYLRRDKYQFHVKHLSPELNSFKEYLEENSGKNPRFSVKMLYEG